MSEQGAHDLEAVVVKRLLDGIVNHAIYMLDPAGHVVTWNVGAAKLKGYRRAEIVGRHFSVFYTDEDRLAGVPAAALEAALRDGRYAVAGWRVRKDGSRFWASVDIQPVRDEQGQLVGFAKITRDESDGKTIESLREQLFRAQKLESLGQLTGGVAHEFNNILTAVAGSLDLMARYGAQERITKVAEVAHQAVDRGKTLVAQLLAYARRQRLQPAPCDINQLIAGFEALLRQAAPGALTLVFRYAEGALLANIDESQFQAALLNLAINARDASPHGATVTIRTELQAIGVGSPLSAHLPPGDYVSISVIDSGHGMSDLVRERATEPFFTTKGPGGGSGLGLSQVDGFMRQSGGLLVIESEPGAGTIMRLLLPSIAPTERPPASILVVEDDPLVREIAVETLREDGYEVYVAADATEALAILSGDARIDVLFSDIVMPRGMDGLELARLVRKQRPTTRLLLTSGFAASIERMHGDFEGIQFLPKPYRDRELHERIAKLVPQD